MQMSLKRWNFYSGVSSDCYFLLDEGITIKITIFRFIFSLTSSFILSADFYFYAGVRTHIILA